MWLLLESVDEVTIQMKAIEQYFRVLLGFFWTIL